MLHRLRSVLVRPGRDRLTGRVEVDETFIGGEEPGLSGGRARARNPLWQWQSRSTSPVATAGSGWASSRMPRRPACTRLSPRTSSRAAPSSPTAGRATAGSNRFGYTSDRRSQRAARARGEDPGELLPGVHRVASLAKRWLLGTHQGSVDEAHLQSYLDEFTFRFNRRRSSSRGMVFYRVLQLAVGHTPVRYRDLVVDSRSKKIKPVPPGGGGNPPSLDRPRAARPWRAADLQ